MAEKLAENNVISSEEKEIYTYGLKEGFFMFFNFLTIVLVGGLLGMIWESLLFMVTYIPLRSFAGGYHAKKRIHCYLLSVCIIVTSLFLAQYLVDYVLIVYAIGIVGLIVLWIKAPIDNSAKRIDDSEKKVYRRCVRISVLSLLFFSYLSYFLHYSLVAVILLEVTSITAVLVLVGEYSNKIKKC